MNSPDRTANGLIRELAVADELPRLRHQVAEYVQRSRAPEPVVERVRLAVSEALTNIIMHAYLGEIPAA